MNKKNNKILSFSQLEKKIQNLKLRNKKIVLCHGVFDLLHIGHIKHFEEAKNFGDTLVVTITPDEYVNKGFNRPAFNTNLRLEALAALEIIDFISINKWRDAENTIKVLKPNIYCKGPDYKNSKDDLTGKIISEKEAAKKVKAKIKFTQDITFSSSNLINNHIIDYSESQLKFLTNLKKKLKDTKVENNIKINNKTNVLLIGESIIDEYVFCEALGKSGKEPVLALRDLYTKIYPGGAIAIAKHLSDFCKQVTFVTMIGEDNKYKDLILRSLPKNVKTYFISKLDSPTIIKKRYIEKDNKNKLIGVYKINDGPLKNKNEIQLNNYLKKFLPKNDIIITSDYGHGFISQFSANLVSKSKKFTALNAQVNASNIGYHSLAKYKNIDTIIINETELRHELRDRNGKLENLIKILSKKILCKYLVVTSGSDGVCLYNVGNDKFYYCPAFASKIIDKVGAGDTMLAILSILLKEQIDIDLALFISSIAASESVEALANSITIKKSLLFKKADHMLK